MSGATPTARLRYIRSVRVLAKGSFCIRLAGRLPISLALSLALTAGLACSRVPDTPAGVVEAYFRYLGRDPGRALPLLSPAFHKAHGLRVADLRGWIWVGSADLDASKDSGPVAWMMVQSDPQVQDLAKNLKVDHLEEEVEGGQATVRTRVTPPGGFPFHQTFRLSRSDSGHWQIDAIEQTEVIRRDLGAAFAAYPNRKTLHRIRPPELVEALEKRREAAEKQAQLLPSGAEQP